MSKQAHVQRWKTWLFWGAAAACPLFVGGYFLTRELWASPPGHADATAHFKQRDGIAVNVIHPRKGEMDRTTSQPGSVHAFEAVQLYAGVTGYLKTMKVDIGDMVTEGQILAQVDVPELEKQVQRFRAMVEQANAKVLQMQAHVANAEAELLAAKTAVPQAEATAKSKAAELRFRQKQLERMRELFATKSIDERLVDEKTEQRDSAREAEIAAREGVNSAKAREVAMSAKIQQAKADVQEAQAEVKVAQAELEKAQVLVQFATVKAPFDGVITERNFDRGAYVRAASEAGGRSSLLTLQRTDLMRVVVQIPDRDVPYCDPGDEAVVEIDALSDADSPSVPKFPAKVARVARSEDQGTRLMRVEIDLPNPTGKICHGMYGKVTIILNKSDMLAIPSSCLVGKAQNGMGKVYVVKQGKACLTDVTIGADNGLRVGILKGLTEKDQILLRPRSEITDGAAVVATVVESSPATRSGH